MSTEKKIPPIQLAPVKHFTIRLVNGHFVRIPRAENIAVTDATRPPSTLRQETSAHGDGTLIPRGLRLENGHFVSGKESAPVQTPPTPMSTAHIPKPLPPEQPSPKEPASDSWAYVFGTPLDPSDSPPKT